MCREAHLPTMSVDPDEGGGGDMTLAFDLEALSALADPRAVFADARGWSRHVGAVANDAEAVAAFARKHRLTQDYEIGDYERRAVLSRLKWEADTDRFVFVGTGDRDRELAEHVGWEYLPVEEAAARAGWTLAEDAGLVERLRVRLVRLLVRPVSTG